MRRKPPLTPGQRCPAIRGNKAYDPTVKQGKVTSNGSRVGVRDCGRCGAKDIPVEQSVDYQSGAPMSAWYYAAHNVPNCKQVSSDD